MRQSTRDDYARSVLRVQQHIEAHLDDRPTPRALARTAGMSLHHFHRVFRGMTGESVMQYARRLRLERAARQLRDTDRGVLEVALTAGYGSHAAFTRAFAEAFGRPPSDWREQANAVSPDRCGVPVAVPSHVRVRTEPACDVVTMRHTGPYTGVPAVWEKLHRWWHDHADALGLPVDGGAQAMFGIVPDDPQVTPPERLRFDACIRLLRTLPRVALPDGPVTLSRVPAGTYAVHTHVGSYEGLSDAYVALIGAWFPQSGYWPAHAPVVEAYLNSPDRTAPEALRTEIRVRLASGPGRRGRG